MLMQNTVFSEIKRVVQTHTQPRKYQAVKSTRKNPSSIACMPCMHCTACPCQSHPGHNVPNPGQIVPNPGHIVPMPGHIAPNSGHHLQSQVSGNTEASALSAVEQLMEEETQAAARAAAKKAKKLKQKSKKQQAQQPESPLHGRVPDESDDSAKQSTSAPGHTQPTPLVLHPQLQPEMPSAAFEGFSSAPTDLHLTERRNFECSAAALSAADLDLQSDGTCTPDSRVASGQRTAGSSCSEDDQLVRQLNSLQLPAAAMSPACCASASSEEADVASSGMDATSELDKDAQFLQALFCCPITKVKCTYLAG